MLIGYNIYVIKTGENVGKLYSPSSPSDAIPLRGCQRMSAWDAGYEAASRNQGAYFFPFEYFCDVAGIDSRVPDITEDDPQFWEWVHAVTSGARAYIDNHKYCIISDKHL